MTSVLPSHARAVIVGGGIVGCSVAYHLARLGYGEVLLLERNKLTSGTTHHAAGLVGQLRSNANITAMLGRSIDLYASLEEETGQASGFKMNGGLRLACTPERLEELKRQATTARSFGLDMHMLSAREAQELWPPMRVDDVLGAAFLPSDGQANPSDITLALVRGARKHGARIVEDCAVTGVRLHGGRVTGIDTEHGHVGCEAVVNCCGQWAREFGALAGVNVPLVSVQHQYLVTGPVEGVTPGLPTLRDPDRLTYYKEEVGGLAMGGYEPNPIPWALAGIPAGFHFSLLDSDWEHFEPMMRAALERVPAFEHAQAKQLVNGPESFTPDGNFILGEAPEVHGYFVGAGFNAFGIAAAGGAGLALAEWIAAGEPPYDLWPVDIRRFGAPHADVTFVRERTLELYARHYALSWPHGESQSARPCRRSPLYERLRAARACFGEKLGWERANWFAPDGVEPLDTPSFGHANWFGHVAAEHRAARERAVLIDQSSFAKYLIVGRDASDVMEQTCANRVARDVGSVVYTQALNVRGGIEADLTVTRIAEDRYYVVSGTGFATRDRNWLERSIPDEANAQLVDVTSANAVLSLMGPLAREVLVAAGAVGVDDASLPFLTMREVQIAGATLMALRVSYIGELGYELHVPSESAVAVFDALHDAGAPLGMVNAGYRAIESLRLEKTYRAWGADVGPDYTPLEAGLGFAVKLASNTPFVGRDALLAQRTNGLNKRLTAFTVDDPNVVLLGRETIYRDGERVGWLSSGGYGHTVGNPIGLGYVRNEAGVDRDFVLDGRYELEVAGERVPASVGMRPLYDPTGERMRGQ